MVETMVWDVSLLVLHHINQAALFCSKFHVGAHFVTKCFPETWKCFIFSSEPYKYYSFLQPDREYRQPYKTHTYLAPPQHCIKHLVLEENFYCNWLHSCNQHYPRWIQRLQHKQGMVLNESTSAVFIPPTDDVSYQTCCSLLFTNDAYKWS
jgi:hypothetical protein